MKRQVGCTPFVVLCFAEAARPELPLSEAVQARP
jgi:hypothetical protein